MHRPNFRSPNSCGGGEGSPGPFRSPGPMAGSGSPMLPPPPPPWGYGSPHTPNYGQRPARPYGSGGAKSPRSSPQSPYGGWYGGQSPGNSTPRRASPRYNVSPYNKSPGGNSHHYQQYNARGYTSPRHPGNYQGSPRTSTPYGTAHGRENRVSDIENYYRPSMLEDPWADLEPVSLSDVDEQNCSDQTANTGKRGRYFS